MKEGLQLDRPVTDFLSDAALTLREDLTLDEALANLRGRPASARGQTQVIYLYVTNEREQLVGVLPVRHLILSPGDARVGSIMIREIIAMGRNETLFDALELFAMHRLLAIPVIDEERHFLGIVEVSLYTEEVFDLAQNRELNEVFQLIGLRVEQQKQGSPWKGFQLRMPWLVSNITGGLICAALGSFFESTVQKVVLIALFIPLILTLAESISVQSMTLAIERAMARRQGGGGPGRRAIFHELSTSLMLGCCSGLLVGAVSLFWRGPLPASAVIAGAVCAAMVLAALLGQTVPGVIHRVKLNPRIAAGPITLAVVDVVTITVYLSAATLVLGK
jgi:magnesium transporter